MAGTDSDDFEPYVPPRYPWADWLKERGSTRLIQGVDFQCSLGAMRSSIYQAASSRKLHVRTHTLTDDRGRPCGVIINPTVADMREQPAPKRGRPSKYPYREWLAAEETVLVRGEHYDQAPSKIMSLIQEAAARATIAVELEKNVFDMIRIRPCTRCAATPDAYCPDHRSAR